MGRNVMIRWLQFPIHLVLTDQIELFTRRSTIKMAPGEFRFLELPLELRRMIYSYATVPTTDIRLYQRSHPSLMFDPIGINTGLLYASKQIHEEASAAIYTYCAGIIGGLLHMWLRLQQSADRLHPCVKSQKISELKWSDPCDDAHRISEFMWPDYARWMSSALHDDDDDDDKKSWNSLAGTKGYIQSLNVRTISHLKHIIVAFEWINNLILQCRPYPNTCSHEIWTSLMYEMLSDLLRCLRMSSGPQWQKITLQMSFHTWMTNPVHGQCGKLRCGPIYLRDGHVLEHEKATLDFLIEYKLVERVARLARLRPIEVRGCMSSEFNQSFVRAVIDADRNLMRRSHRSRGERWPPGTKTFPNKHDAKDASIRSGGLYGESSLEDAISVGPYLCRFGKM